MHYYIVDPKNLSQKIFERVQNQLYSSLSAFKISGEVTRVTSLRTIQQLVDTAFERNVKTLVAVGDDSTLQDVINASQGRDVTFAYIPLHDTLLSRIFGLPDIEAACKSIAARRIEQVDLGLVNNSWFITEISFGQTQSANKSFFGLFSKAPVLPSFTLKFLADGKLNGSVEVVAGTIMNARDNNVGLKKLADPTDGSLDMMLLPANSDYQSRQNSKHLNNLEFEKIPGHSLMHLKKIEITSPEGLSLRAGDKVLAKTPAMIEVLPKALKLIVGRDRAF